jgi:hypothetical protein
MPLSITFLSVNRFCMSFRQNLSIICVKFAIPFAKVIFYCVSQTFRKKCSTAILASSSGEMH